MSDPTFDQPTSDSPFEKVSRRGFLKLAGALAGGLALAACSPGQPTTQTSASAGGGAGASAATMLGVGNNGQIGKGRSGTAGDALFICGEQWGAPANFNPFSPTAAWPCTANQMQLVFETPLRWNVLTGEIMPGVCTYTADGTNSITLKMQDGVQFSDGTPCTAKDVAWSFNIGKENKDLGVAGVFGDIDSIDATDDTTVVVKINQTNKNVSEVLRILCENSVVSQASLSAFKASELLTAQVDKPIGTGPFPLSKADQTQLVFQLNENYWGKTVYGGLPTFSQVVHPIFKTNDDSNIQFQNGTIDVAQAFIAQIWKMWEGGKPVGTYIKDKPYFVPASMPMLLMNTTKAGLDEAVVRKAIATAIDYASISDTAMSGYSAAVQASLILPDGAEKKWFNQDEATANGWTYDAAAAEKLLTDAGATKGSDGVYVLNGKRLGPWKLITPTGWTDWNASCDIIAKNLKAIGMDVSTNYPQQAPCTQAIQGGTFDLAVWYVSSTTASAPWGRFRDIMSQSQMKPVGQTTFYNYGRWKNDQAEALLTAAASATDDDAKKTAYDALDALFRKEVPSCPIMYRPDEFWEYNASNFYNFPDEKNPYAPPMFRGAGNTWWFKLTKIAS